MIEPWSDEFPDLPHPPQDLDLVRQCLSWTPAQRFANVVRVARWVERARLGRWLGPVETVAVEGAGE